MKIHSESKKKHRLFQFSISIHKLLIVLYSMIVISHWLMFVAIYVILSKINVTNKVGQLKVSPLVLNVSFICDKTSPGKGGMIGTVYHNYHRPALINYIYLSRSSPEDPANLKSGTRMSYTDLCMPNQALQIIANRRPQA